MLEIRLRNKTQEGSSESLLFLPGRVFLLLYLQCLVCCRNSIILCRISEGENEDCGKGWAKDSLPLIFALPFSWITRFMVTLQPWLYLILGFSNKELLRSGREQGNEEGKERERATLQQRRKDNNEDGRRFPATASNGSLAVLSQCAHAFLDKCSHHYSLNFMFASNWMNQTSNLTVKYD